VDIGVRRTYADLGATIMDNFGLTGLEFGTSFLGKLQ
jgi:phosphopentomutase